MTHRAGYDGTRPTHRGRCVEPHSREPAMSPQPVLRVLIVLLLVCGSLVSSGGSAQERQSGVIVATGLTNPRGALSVGDLIFVALAGGGGANPADNGWSGGTTSAVALVEGTGCPGAIVTGLPSSLAANGSVLGASDVAILGDQLYVAVDGGGSAFGNSDQASGIYRLLAEGEAELIAELPDDLDADLAARLGDAVPAASFGMVADGANGVLWVVDARSGDILTVGSDGTTSLVTTLSGERALPTRPVLDGNGGIYVGVMSDTPLVDGSASIVQVGPDGSVSEVWSDLTAVVDVAVDDAGTLYALELTTDNGDDPSGINPSSGRLLQQTPDGSEVIATNLAAPIALDLGLDGTSLYVSMPAIGANDGNGVIVQFRGDAETVTPGECEPLAETLFVPDGGQATPVAAPAQPSSTAEATPTEIAPPPTPEPNVVIADFTFQPAVLEVTVGEQVIFFNNDAVAHTATSEDGSFDTGNIAPGLSATVTFDKPGTFTYVCSYHPGMAAGTIVVSAAATPVASPIASLVSTPVASPESSPAP